MNKTTKLRQQIFAAPKAAENDDIHAAITLPTTGTTVVTTAITNPDIPRTVRLKGNQATVQGLEVILAGTDILDQAITETVTMGGDYTTATDSVKAFKTVTSITVPTRGAASDTISVGLGAALGLDSYCDAHSFTGIAGVTSFAYDTAVLSKNVVTLTASLDGSTDQAIPYIPNTFPTYGRIYG